MGSLDVLKVEGTPDGEAIILCHGYGANAMDLLPLSGYLKVRPGTNWYFPEAPMEIPLGPGYVGRAWFPLISDAINHLAAAGRFADFSKITPTGLDSARSKLDEMISRIPTPINKITLGGFSQGSMLTTDYFLRRKENPKGLIILSGTLICEDEWKELAKQKSRFQFFQSHGTDDQVLPYSSAKKLEMLLRDSGLSGEFVSFQGGHEIPEKVLKRLSEYLRRD
ncbi:MAG: esterase [Leptospira sp.]|nr:esterase [Leptospira sp.]